MTANTAVISSQREFEINRCFELIQQAQRIARDARQLEQQSVGTDARLPSHLADFANALEDACSDIKPAVIDRQMESE